MTKRPDEGHEEQMLDLMRENDLFAVGTLFKPKKKMWGGKIRICNATYRSKEAGKRPRKLDYICVSNRWKSLMNNVEVRWGPSIHRFGKSFDHGFLSAIWRWKTSKKEKVQRSNFAAMTSQSWPEFDTRLRIKLQKQEQPPKNEVGYEMSNETAETAQDLESEYAKLSKCVKETIDEIVPEKQWMRKNGRVVTQATRDLFEKRAKEYGKKPPSPDRRKRWNKVIRDACKNDYRKWVSDWVERIEKADHKGDTKAIYSGVKALSGAKRTISKRPTMRAATAASCTTAGSQRTSAKKAKTHSRASVAKSVTATHTRASNGTETRGLASMNRTNENGRKRTKCETDPGGDKLRASEKAAAASEGAKVAVPETEKIRASANTVTEEKRPQVRISGPEELAGV